jgi:cytochrome P450
MNGADSLFTAAGETHQRIRKNFINAFSDRALKDQSPIIDSYASLLMTRLRREIGKSSEGKVDVAKYYGYATLDIIADLTFGESFDGLEGDNEHSWILGFFLGAKFGSVRNSLSRFHPIDKLFGWVFLRLTAKNRATSWRIATDKISRRLEMGDLGPSRSDFITPIVGRLDESQQKGITRKELNTNGLAVVIAGCQLTTVALATSTYLLMRYPETLKRLTKEVRESFKSEADITIQSTLNLPYLQAVINETLRIHHPTPINMPRVVPPEGSMVDGDWIPGGVSASLLSHRLFGRIHRKMWQLTCV